MIRVAVLAVALVACSRTPAPRDPTERALYRDLERQVTLAAATGWGVDRLELDGMLETALDSVCRVDGLGRRGLRDWLDTEIARRGVPVEKAWRDHGKDLSEISELLVIHRVRMLFVRADEAAVECPFWVEPVNPFRGRQISENPLADLARRRRQGERDPAGRPSGSQLRRCRPPAHRPHVLAGRRPLHRCRARRERAVSQGRHGRAHVRPDQCRPREPIVYRRTLLNAYWELEAGWLGHSTEEDWGAIDHGVHVGFAVGGRALRQRFFFPGAALGLAVERVFVEGDDLIAVKLGARAAFDIDL